MRYVDEQTAYEQFDDFLDEVHPVIEILGMSYNPSTVLKECDPNPTSGESYGQPNQKTQSNSALE